MTIESGNLILGTGSGQSGYGQDQRSINYL